MKSSKEVKHAQKLQGNVYIITVSVPIGRCSRCALACRQHRSPN